METIHLTKLSPELDDFMTMPNGTYKNVLYYREWVSKKLFENSITYKDNKMYYSCSFVTVKKSKSSYYLHRSAKQGFTFEKGKLSIWFNKSIYEITGIHDVFAHLRFNWLVEGIHPYITKSIFEKMLTGKITNSVDIAKTYLSKMGFKDVSPKLFVQWLGTFRGNKQDILRNMSVAKDVNHLLERDIKNRESRYSTDFDYEHDQLFLDMVQQALILNKKIDFKWSKNKCKEVHKEWTLEIMESEINTVDAGPLDHLLPYQEFKRDGFKLLMSQKDVFIEGTTMKHCVYTNYWSQVKRNEYIVYHVTLNGEEATLGANIYENAIVYNQCYKYGNQSVSDSTKEAAKDFIRDLRKFAIEKKLIKDIVDQPL